MSVGQPNLILAALLSSVCLRLGPAFSASAGLPSVCLRTCTVVLVPIYPGDGGSAVCYGGLPVIRCRTDVTCVQCVLVLPNFCDMRAS